MDYTKFKLKNIILIKPNVLNIFLTKVLDNLQDCKSISPNTLDKIVTSQNAM